MIGLAGMVGRRGQGPAVPVRLESRTFFPTTNTRVAGKMLYLVGLGLSDETDITVKGLEVVKKASRVYLEAYTSILLVDKAVLVSPPTNMLRANKLTPDLAQ